MSCIRRRRRPPIQPGVASTSHHILSQHTGTVVRPEKNPIRIDSTM
jgi:hypothetical protein